MVTSDMETRQHRKRRWKSSPNKSVRAELDFGQKTPSPKKCRRDENNKTEVNQEDYDSFTIKSFYGKREKMCFPHSPGRRKKIGQVLDKLSDDNTESESEKPGRRSSKIEKTFVSEVHKSDFHFHSSDSAETDTESKINSTRTQCSSKKGSAKKVPLDIFVKKKEPKTPRTSSRSSNRVLSSSTSKLPSRPALAQIEPQLQTPTSGRKFFKSRSPASADKSFGSIVVHKGFNLQFVANKKAQASKKSKSTVKKTKSKAEKPSTPKGVSVKTLKKSVSVEDQVLYVEDNEKTGNELEMRNLKRHDDVKLKKDCESDRSKEEIHKGIANDASQIINDQTETVIETDKTKQFIDKDWNDSAIDTANSEDLFSNVSDHPGEGIPVNLDFGFEQLENGCSTPSRGTPSSSVSPVSESSSVVSGSQQSQSGKKLFPIFNQGMRTPQTGGTSSLRKLRSSRSPGGSPLLRYMKSKDKMEQMIIDAGQKKFGVTQCGICGMVYSQADPADETVHHKFHQGMLNALRFPGWKKEHVVQEFLEFGSRIIMIQAGDHAYATKKIEEINNIMGRELGFPEQHMVFTPQYKAFLYISSEKRIEGCCIAEPITEGYPVLPGGQSHSPSPQKHPGQRPWYCSDKPKEALIGISKIWVYSQSRKQGIATKLLNCVRQWSMYGSVIPKDKVAFSDPTPDGKKLAEKYLESAEFLVYKFQ